MADFSDFNLVQKANPNPEEAEDFHDFALHPDSLGIPMQGTPQTQASLAQTQTPQVPDQPYDWGLPQSVRHILGSDQDTPLGNIDKILTSPLEVGAAGIEGLNKAYNYIGDQLPHGLLSSLWELPSAFPMGSPEVAAASDIAGGSRALSQASAAQRLSAPAKDTYLTALKSGTPQEIQDAVSSQGFAVDPAEVEKWTALPQAEREKYAATVYANTKPNPVAPVGGVAPAEVPDDVAISAAQDVVPTFGDRGIPDRRQINQTVYNDPRSGVDRRGTDDTLTQPNGTVQPVTTYSTDQVKQMVEQPVQQSQAADLRASNDTRSQPGNAMPEVPEGGSNKDFADYNRQMADHFDAKAQTWIDNGRPDFAKNTQELADNYRASASRYADKALAEKSKMVEQPSQQQQANAGGTPPEEPAPEKTPEEHLLEGLDRAANARDEQATLKTQELARRMAIGSTNAAGKGPEEAIAAKLGALKGAYPKVDYDNLANYISGDAIQGLRQKIQQYGNTDYFGHIAADKGLKAMLSGEAPPPHQLNALAKVFGKDFVEKLSDHGDLLANVSKSNNFGKTSQIEMFKQGETLSTPPEGTPGLTPDKDILEKTYFPSKKQGDLFATPAEPKPEKPLGYGKEQQNELFPDSETLSTGPDKAPLAPEPKAIDPDKFVRPKGQADFWRTHPDDPKSPVPKGIVDHLVDIAGIPRAITTSFDLSFPFRQGAFLVRRPEFWQNFGKMFKVFGSEKGAADLAAHVESHPLYETALDAGLNVGKDQHEEGFLSSIARHLPGVKQSERAYSGMARGLRMDTFAHLMDTASRTAGDVSPDFAKQAARYVNNATGAGNFGKYGGATQMLNTVFFSPRFQMSRLSLMNPEYYSRMDPALRVEAMKDLAGFGAYYATVTGLAAFAGAKAVTNLTSTDAGKNVLGDTHYDNTAGFGSWVRLASQLALGQKTGSSGTSHDLGNPKFGQQDRVAVLGSFIRSKLAPVPAMMMDLWNGKDVVGNPTRDTVGMAAKTVAKRTVIPMTIQDAYDAMTDDGNFDAATIKKLDAQHIVEGILKASPGIVGSSVATYKPGGNKKTSTDFSDFKLDGAPATNEDFNQFSKVGG